MAIDLAVLGYYNVLRIQGWIGNLAMHIEHEFFGMESPTAKFGKKWGRVEGLQIEDSCRRFAQQLIPLLEKANKLTIRNLKAVRELRIGPLPNVSINNPGQVNVGAVQQNVAQAVPNARRRVGVRPDPEATPTRGPAEGARRRRSRHHDRQVHVRHSRRQGRRKRLPDRSIADPHRGAAWRWSWRNRCAGSNVRSWRIVMATMGAGGG